MSKEKALITIIVPVYNVEQYIHRCIDSILHQTFTDFELILVDDGSPDNCPSICDEYVNKDKRIHVIHQKNRGISVTRNVGLEWFFRNTNSEYVAFIDSDDWVHPRYLETLYDAITRYDADVSVALMEKVQEGLEPLSTISNRAPVLISNTEACHRIGLPENGEAYAAVWGKLFRRELWSTIRFPEGKLWEDMFIVYRVLYSAKRIALSEQHLYYYLQRKTGICRSTFDARVLDRIDALKERTAFYLEHNEVDLYEKTFRQLLYEEYDKFFWFRDVLNDQIVANSIKSDFDKLWKEYHSQLSIIERLSFMRIHNKLVHRCWPIIQPLALSCWRSYKKIKSKR